MGPNYGSLYKKWGFYLHTDTSLSVASRCGCTVTSADFLADDGGATWQTLLVVKDATSVTLYTDGANPSSCTFSGCSSAQMIDPGTLIMGGDLTAGSWRQ